MGPVRIAIFDFLLDEGGEWTPQEIADRLGMDLGAATKTLANMAIAKDAEWRDHPTEKMRNGAPARLYRLREGVDLPKAEDIIKAALQRRHPLEMVWRA